MFQRILLWDVVLTLGEIDRCDVLVMAHRKILFDWCKTLNVEADVVEHYHYLLSVEVGHQGDLVGLLEGKRVLHVAAIGEL